jgi:hypothetical protein
MKLFRAVAAVLVFRLARWCAEVGALIIVKQRVTNASLCERASGERTAPVPQAS